MKSKSIANDKVKHGKSIIPDGEISYNDIKQGGLGNCWSLAAFQSVASHPDRMRQVFVNDLTNPDGHYSFNFWNLGVPITITVDDRIPFMGEKPWASNFGPKNAKWPLLMEKAMAKMRGSYSRIDGGQSYRGIRFLRGGPWNIYDINNKYTGKGMATDDIWETITEHLTNDDLMTAGTRQSHDGSDTHKLASGLYTSHAYAVLKRKQLPDGTRVVVLRNPHGKDSFWGAENVDNYDEDAWTKKLVDAGIPEAANKDDGIIFVPVEQFAQDIRELRANYNSSTMKFDYFL